jgi:hypothetical protein
LAGGDLPDEGERLGEAIGREIDPVGVGEGVQPEDESPGDEHFRIVGLHDSSPLDCQ